MQGPETEVATRQEAVQRHRVQQAQLCIRDALKCLKPIAESYACVLVQTELQGPTLEALGFSRLMTVEQAIEHAQTATYDTTDGILVVSFGCDASCCLEVVGRLDESNNAPMLMVVLIVSSPEVCSMSDIEDPLLRGASFAAAHEWEALDAMDIGVNLAEGRHQLHMAGADDVICLCDGEMLQPYRLMEAVDRHFEMGVKTKAAIDDEIARQTSHERKRCGSKILHIYNKIMDSLPGEVIDGLPREDQTIEEEVTAEKQPVRIGDYRLTSELRSGNFGSAYRATHANGQPYVLKVLAKARRTKSTGQLVRFELESRLMIFVPVHGNIVRAHTVLHSKSYLCLVMDYAGQESVDAYARRVTGETGGLTLPSDVISAFCRQQVCGIAHLHRHMVCHRDISPDNWLVSDCGTTLRLTEFSKAINVVSAEEPLKSGCGALPFCAPEMLGRHLVQRGIRERNMREGHPALMAIPGYRGYDGFAADIWSLGLNFTEFLLGPFSVERLMEWTEQIRKDEWECLRSISRMPALMEQALRDTTHPLVAAIKQQVVSDATKRWSVEAVAAAVAGLNGV